MSPITRMAPKKVAVYLGSATVLAAWLASAAVVEQTPQPTAAPTVQTTGTETLAEEVQAQAGRLRERLAAAPAPQQPVRNPFAFAPKPVPRPARTPARLSPTPSPPVLLPEPALALIGLAEDQSPKGPIRTAIISAEADELFMVKVGDFIGARYRVDAIGADAVELFDLTTSSVRRLALR
jgi:hypothetical protein